MSAGSALGRPLFSITASDIDTGRNGEITYSILPSDSGSNLFSINRDTGMYCVYGMILLSYVICHHGQ